MTRYRSGLGAFLTLAMCLSLTGCGGNSAMQLPQIGESSLQKAVELYQKGQYVDCELEAEKATKDRKDYGFAGTILSEALCSQNKFSEAEVAAREAVRYEPRVANSHAALSRALIGLGASQEAEYEAGQALVLPEATATPSSRSAQQTLLATSLQMQLKIPAAEEAYQAAIQADPGFGLAYSGYGVMLSFLGRNKEAAPKLERAIQLIPDNVSALAAYVAVLTNLGKYPQAIQACEKLVALTPKDANPYVLQSIIAWKQGRYQDAESAARKAIKLNPMYGPGYTCLAASLHKLGKLTEAEAAGVKATQLAPADPYAYFTLARVLADEKKWIMAGGGQQDGLNLRTTTK